VRLGFRWVFGAGLRLGFGEMVGVGVGDGFSLGDCDVCCWSVCVLWVKWMEETHFVVKTRGVAYRASRTNMFKSQSVVRMETWTVREA
jgi:hypothetical protein